ncbi:hypothetical protein [Oryzobacter telluris]|uniref:hypothetical protein n=1 Tax=Oryzobacter telluris TaxID=3149179 RepID=UPI00370DE115
MAAKVDKPPKQDGVVVHATFAAAPKPYNEKYSEATTISKVMEDALAFFEIQTDGTTRYYFVANGDEQDPGTTVGEIAEDGPGQSRSIKLSLRTETISGS